MSKRINTSLSKITLDKLQEPLIFFIRPGGYPEVSGFTVYFTDLFQIDFIVKGGFEDLFSGS